jgi:hypothetical protein
MEHLIDGIADRLIQTMTRQRSHDNMHSPPKLLGAHLAVAMASPLLSQHQTVTEIQKPGLDLIRVET